MSSAGSSTSREKKLRLELGKIQVVASMLPAHAREESLVIFTARLASYLNVSLTGRLTLSSVCVTIGRNMRCLSALHGVANRWLDVVVPMPVS